MSKRPPRQRATVNSGNGRMERIEAQARETADRVSRTERELADDRLGRIERATESFQAAVRGAFTVQQDQITNLYRATEDLRQSTAELRQSTVELRETVNQVIREWQAYLRTIHPPQ